MLLFPIFACNTGTRETGQEPEFLDVKGTFLGQPKVEYEPVMFAPGIISTDKYERDAAFSGWGRDLFYTVKEGDKYKLMYTRMDSQKETWTVPEVAPFSGTYNDIEPCFAYRQKGLYFISNRPVDGKEKDEMDFDIWFTLKTLAGWSEPQNLGSPINTTQLEAFPSVTKNGTLYFVRNDKENTRSDVYRAKFTEGQFEEPEKLPEVINAEANPFNACISPDETYLVFCALREGGFGGADYWISFRDRDDNWSEPVNLGDRFNTPQHEKSPRFSTGGSYFFFCSEGNPMGIPDSLQKEISDTPNSDIYWVRAEVLEELEK
jgi:hypothetical protein